jgi:hypothetical protein
VIAATVGTLAIAHFLRESFDSTWFLGSLPADVELVAYGALALITVTCAGCVCIAFSFAGGRRKSCWMVVGVLSAALIGLAVVARQSVWDPSPTSLLRRIVNLEQQAGTDPGMTQELSVMLANCGRETDAEAVPRRGSSGRLSVSDSQSQVDLSKLQPLPWRKTLTEIATRERLIVIMEAHNAPKHRQWIEQTLAILRDAGFRDYAAEGLGESGRSLKQRGYPIASTGYYVSDPHFGNVLRTAIDLDFDLHDYESHGTSYEQREYAQATNLAKLFSENPKLKLVVHVGYAHVLKTPHEPGVKLMAGHLWEMTGIEPYCIWQMWHSPQEGEARQLAALANTESGPVMLVPAPSGLRDAQFSFPPDAVDALVVHPPSTGGPAERVHGFQTERRQVAGAWSGSEWPVLIGAFKPGESMDAIALDQVMLRNDERDFVLWVPDGAYEIRIFGTKGRMTTNSDGSPIMKFDKEAR